ncbi:MAG: hypothetical protein IJH38_02545 [Clostridia bacterium]|nr:hypothetical protein [Clostridia bacterium]
MNGVLADYEAAQPRYVAQDVAKLFEEADYERLYELDTAAEQFSGEDRQLYLDGLMDLTRGRTVSWDEGISSDEDVRNYSVSVDGERFATFTLVPSGETTSRGNRLWKLGSLSTLVELRQAQVEEPEPEPVVQVYPCRITVPDGFRVNVDGVSLTADNAAVTSKPLFEADFLPEGVAAPMLIEYLYDASVAEPVIEAFDEAGSASTVVREEGERTWRCDLKEDEGFRQQYGDAALALARQVAKFILGDARKKSIQRICAKGSPAEAVFDNLYNRYTTPHDGVAFQNELVDRCYALSENCFTCRVSFDVVLDTKQGKTVDATEYTFCVIRSENKAALYNIMIG